MNKNPKRIIYVDIMRAFAVIMMIQGHTIDTFLSNEYRTMDSAFYSVWYIMRGFTAPIFMFTAGLIFTYLLKANNYSFLSNPRIKKGVKRGLTLIVIGYFLRYPTYRIFDFTYVSKAQWTTFFTVDALHLIGFGLLFIIMTVFIAERIKLSLNIVLISAIALTLMLNPFIAKINWDSYLPEYLSAYMFKKNGSLFPFFPWLFYVFSGALLGNYLYKNEGIYLKKRFSFFLLLSGAALVFTSMVFSSIGDSEYVDFNFWFSSNSIVFFRVGYVVFVNGIISLLVRKLKTIPNLVNETGKKTLMLYIAHVVILYGCAFFPGLYKYFNRSFNTVETLFMTLVMFILMFGLVVLSNKIKFLRKMKPAFNRV